MGPAKAESTDEKVCFSYVDSEIDSVTGKGTIQHMERKIYFDVLPISKEG